MRTSASVNVAVQARPVNCDPWTPFQVSSGDLGLVDLFVAARGDVKDLACDISVYSADCFGLGMAMRRATYSVTFGAPLCRGDGCASCPADAA